MQDIIIFGTGEVGQEAVMLLKDKYHILFLVDNARDKWGSFLEGYTIKAPDEIQYFDCDVVVASTKYVIEISDQLQRMDVNKKKIFLYARYLTDSGYQRELYPLDARKIIGTGKDLQEYDLINMSEQRDRNIKVMIFCMSYSVYTKQLIENMSRRYDDIEFSLITKEKKYKEKIMSENLKHIYCFLTMADLKSILDGLPVYDAMQLLWIEREWSYFYELIRTKTRYLNLNVGGSDFYRSGKEKRDYKRNLIACADRVTAETYGTLCEFQQYYIDETKGKMSLLPFGIEVLDFINLVQNRDMDELKKKYHIPLNKVIVTCGHNASEAHQHLDMIDALCNLRDSERYKIVCVFPMTYGKDGTYIDKVRLRLEETGLEYVILTDFMDFQSMAEYALLSDIMIHVQTTDQLSSTMLEEMYAGSVIIAGCWLPYESLRKMGIYFLSVNTIPDITPILEDVITNIDIYRERCRKNRDIVWKHSSWDMLAPSWRALWK